MQVFSNEEYRVPQTTQCKPTSTCQGFGYLLKGKNKRITFSTKSAEIKNYSKSASTIYSSELGHVEYGGLSLVLPNNEQASNCRV